MVMSGVGVPIDKADGGGYVDVTCPCCVDVWAMTGLGRGCGSRIFAGFANNSIIASILDQYIVATLSLTCFSD